MQSSSETSGHSLQAAGARSVQGEPSMGQSARVARLAGKAHVQTAVQWPWHCFRLLESPIRPERRWLLSCPPVNDGTVQKGLETCPGSPSWGAPGPGFGSRVWALSMQLCSPSQGPQPPLLPSPSELPSPRWGGLSRSFWNSFTHACPGPWYCLFFLGEHLFFFLLLPHLLLPG